MKIKIIVFCLFVACIFAAPPARGQTVEIPLADLQKLRELAADRDFQKNRADLAETQGAEWKGQAEKWRALYESEKNRADNVQGGRVAELQAANNDFKSEVAQLKLSIGYLRDQSVKDKEQIGQLNFDVRKLKSERKYIFTGGVLVGGAAGFYAGKNFNRARDSVVNILTPNGNANRFGATFQF